MITLTLPFPSNKLSPNQRLHWAQKDSTRKAQKEAGYYFARPFRGHVGKKYTPLSLMFIPPNRCHFDLDGLLSRMKAALDGVALGLGVNDAQFRPITIDIGAPDKTNPHVVVTIGAA